MTNVNGVPTPIMSMCKLSKHGAIQFADPALYRFIVDVLQYVTLTRPDIVFSVNKAFQFMTNPPDTQWSVV